MSPIHLEEKDHIAVVTIDYPPVNATGPGFMQELTEIFDSLHEGEARVAILTAAGERAFCAGADIRAASSGTPQRNDRGRGARETFSAMYECPIPVIGAINGPTLGAGICLAASCDFLIASEKANFALPEIDVGLMGGARHLGRLFPQGFVRWMHYTGVRVSAQEAYRLGVVLRVVPPERLMEEALKEAAVIAAKIPMGIRLAKEGLNLIEWMNVKDGYHFEQTQTAILRNTEDATEARRAFVERRTPVFKGK